MKTILINFGNSFFVRNFLRTDALPILRSAGYIRIVLLAPAEKIEYYKKEFPYPELVFGALPNTKNFLVERFFRFLETASVHTHTATMIRRYDFVRSRGGKFLATRLWLAVLRRACWELGRFRWWRKCIRRVYFLFPSATFREAFLIYKPDLVYCPTMLYHDMRIVKEAKKAGIKTLGMILSWDNLYSKSLIRVHPDRLLVHTELARKQAEKFGDYPPERVQVTGIAQYDRYFTKKDIIPREDFMRDIGADPHKKLIVYGTSGKGSLWIDLDILGIVAEEIKKQSFGEPFELLLRAHPRYDLPAHKLEFIRNQYHFLAIPSTKHLGGGQNDWEFDEEKTAFLANTLAHADIIISMYSTFFIEAAVFDRPLIGIAFDGEKKRPYWDSAVRFFEWDHLKEIRELKGIWHVRSRAELVDAINAYLKNPALYCEGRARMKEVQSQYTDGKSAERVARCMIGLLKEGNSV
ncbi:MAG: CDP-glycerol glycerophosphotransferase family protein [Candidatus Sungbacteria bacterium]|nr:CDP-glycerol glycerophosphotransferase family protein [Candidatus Sungbacteria bacterium]